MTDGPEKTVDSGSDDAFIRRVARYRKMARESEKLPKGMSLKQLAEKVALLRGGKDSLSWVRKMACAPRPRQSRDVRTGKARQGKKHITVSDVIILSKALGVSPLALLIDLDKPFDRCGIEPYADQANYKVYEELSQWFRDDSDELTRKGCELMRAVQLIDENHLELERLEKQRGKFQEQLGRGVLTAYTVENGRRKAWRYRPAVATVGPKDANKDIFDLTGFLKTEEAIAQAWQMLSGGRLYLQKHHAMPDPSSPTIAEDAKPLLTFLVNDYERLAQKEADRPHYAYGVDPETGFDMDPRTTFSQDQVIGADYEWEQQRQTKEQLAKPELRKWLYGQLADLSAEQGRKVVGRQYWQNGEHWMDIQDDIHEVRTRMTDPWITSILEARDDEEAKRKRAEEKARKETEQAKTEGNPSSPSESARP
ncbi:hypothetical protein JS533_001090 [Bifidobacterium amazonense]|uniref:HTH cro/C1-type domain-containing protein n=1 Tax=Bifidobacterium amazonense TaxID=2809027 RepID=A0ABS9VS18_9BIFI|nr:hypothetical protein [Bifidobacterium amazonense]MCH9274883.1 hypothetical protein [Bifidobacterium amazonense]